MQIVDIQKLQLKMDKFKMYKKKWNIHYKETLKFLKKIINENDNIILDNILKNILINKLKNI